MKKVIKQRTMAREVALQFLYQVDVRGLETVSNLKYFLDKYEEAGIAEESSIGVLPDTVKEYATSLILGCVEHWQELEEYIKNAAKNWTLARMTVVDRSIIRIAIYELFYKKEVPPRVAINEAIEMGKKFSTENSGAFINGVLDYIVKNFMKDSLTTPPSSMKA